MNTNNREKNNLTFDSPQDQGPSILHKEKVFYLFIYLKYVVDGEQF